MADEILGSPEFVKVEPLTKGWSSAQKYLVHTAAGDHLLLRIAPVSEHKAESARFDMLGRLCEKGIPTHSPVRFGVSEDGSQVYQLLRWIPGEDAETLLPTLPEVEQYKIGVEAGALLRTIHSILVRRRLEPWSRRYFAVMDEWVDAYRSHGPDFPGNQTILEYLGSNRHLLEGRPQTSLHGDFHEGNLIVAPDGSIHPIDWLDEGFTHMGDPWYDFRTLGENDNAHFATGLVRGYFKGEPPQKFWDLLTYYIVGAALTAIIWTIHHKPDETEQTLRRNQEIAICLSEGRSPLARWYLPVRPSMRP